MGQRRDYSVPPAAAQPRRLAFYALIAVITFAAFMLAMCKAGAHDWYPPWCCNDGDCKPLDPSRVRALDDGSYTIDGRFTVARSEVRQSLDGRYHACFPEPNKLRCFFAPAREM